MVKLSLDTNRDPIADLEEARAILDEAIARRQGAQRPPAAAHGSSQAPQAQMPSAQALIEETALDTPFLKITVSSDELGEPAPQGRAGPSLNELIAHADNESLTEDEIGEMLSSAGVEKPARKEKEAKGEEEGESKDEDAYIEIVEFDEEA